MNGKILSLEEMLAENLITHFPHLSSWEYKYSSKFIKKREIEDVSQNKATVFSLIQWIRKCLLIKEKKKRTCKHDFVCKSWGTLCYVLLYLNKGELEYFQKQRPMTLLTLLIKTSCQEASQN